MSSSLNYGTRTRGPAIFGIHFRTLIITLEDSANCPHRTALVATRARGCEFSTQLVHRHALDDDAARACHRGEEQTLASEQRRLDAAHELYVIVDRFIKGDDTAGFDL